MANLALQQPNQTPAQIMSIQDGLRTLVITNLSGANVYLEKDPTRCNQNDGYTLLPAATFSPNSAWKGDLYASCDLANGRITYLKSEELK